MNPTIQLTNSAGAFYKWASVALRVGNFTGRLSVTVVQVPYLVLLVLALIAFLIMVLFICESALRFINNGMVLIFIMPVMGLCSGIIYSDSMFWIQKRNQLENPRSYAMGMAGTMTDYGVIISTALGTGLEIGLKALHPEDWN